MCIVAARVAHTRAITSTYISASSSGLNYDGKAGIIVEEKSKTITKHNRSNNPSGDPVLGNESRPSRKSFKHNCLCVYVFILLPKHVEI